MKTNIIVGDTLDFETTVTDYPATDGWTLYHRLIPLAAGPTPIDLTGTTASDGVSYRTQAAPATTAAWTAGEYSWASWVAKTGARQQVESGLVTLLPNPATSTTLDSRSHARTVLDAIEAVIEGRATKDQQEYSIGDRSLKRTPLADLIALKRYYAGLVAKEDNDARIANGQSPKNRTQARL